MGCAGVDEPAHRHPGTRLAVAIPHLARWSAAPALGWATGAPGARSSCNCGSCLPRGARGLKKKTEAEVVTGARDKRLPTATPAATPAAVREVGCRNAQAAARHTGGEAAASHIAGGVSPKAYQRAYGCQPSTCGQRSPLQSFPRRLSPFALPDSPSWESTREGGLRGPPRGIPFFPNPPAVGGGACRSAGGAPPQARSGKIESPRLSGAPDPGTGPGRCLLLQGRINFERLWGRLPPHATGMGRATHGSPLGVFGMASGNGGEQLAPQPFRHARGKRVGGGESAASPGVPGGGRRPVAVCSGGRRCQGWGPLPLDLSGGGVRASQP